MNRSSNCVPDVNRSRRKLTHEICTHYIAVCWRRSRAVNRDGQKSYRDSQVYKDSLLTALHCFTAEWPTRKSGKFNIKALETAAAAHITQISESVYIF